MSVKVGSYNYRYYCDRCGHSAELWTHSELCEKCGNTKMREVPMREVYEWEPATWFRGGKSEHIRWELESDNRVCPYCHTEPCRCGARGG